MNLKTVDDILEWLSLQSVQCICLCPGGRNGAFVEALEKSSGFEVLSFYDERSAGFFALGRAKRDQKPVVVITTSGTAVTEVMSAVVEADYSGVPLIVVTADRPRHFRGKGAPQSIEQKNIFGTYVENCYDIAAGENFSIQWDKNQPLHINLCFDEPIIDGIWNEKSYKISENKKKYFRPIQPLRLKKPLIVLGGMEVQSAQAVEKALADWSGPIYAESLSQLKNLPSLKDKQILSGDRFVQKLLKNSIIDSVLRIGDVPVGRFWRDLEELKLPTFSLSSNRFSGVSHGEIQVCDLENIKSEDILGEWGSWAEWFEADRDYYSKVQTLIKSYPQSEVGNYKNLANLAVDADMVYLGNSLPVRLWDLVAENPTHVEANRGVNGIDGQVSTAFGLIKKQSTHWAILGDLTTLYDMSGFWVTPYLEKLESEIRLVVMNNQGGQIFSRMFKSPLFLNQHALSFAPLAAMWNWDYQKTSNISDLKPLSQFQMIEINPDPQQTVKFWEEYDKIWKK